MNDFGHYFKDVSGLQKIDVYRVVELFEVPAGALDHAAKKILCAGFRGVKDQRKDVQEAIKSLTRWLEMREEDERKAIGSPAVGAGPYTGTGGAEVEKCGACRTRHSPLAKCPALDYSTNAPAEPATEIDDDSPRAQAMGQNGNNGEHYTLACRLCRKTINPMLPHLCK